MTQEQNLTIAQEFLGKLGSGDTPENVAALFSENLEWNVPGDVDALPWIGKQVGRKAVMDFVVNTSKLLNREKFDVHDIIANDTKAIILGELGSQLKATGKSAETAYAVVLTIADNQITHFLMLEDSFGVSQASRTS